MTCAFPVDHAAILVSSLERSMPYYRTLLPLLGFEQMPDGLWSNGAGFSLKFAEAEPGRRPYDRHGAGLNHLGFAAPGREALLAVASGMAAAGFEVPDLQKLGKASALFMQDPDGLRFEVSFHPG
ncbi:MAG TPA: VOC family protein [Allosphingosinicella sp.]|nr:VOC family protein [Allosphingosinicella sp.]